MIKISFNFLFISFLGIQVVQAQPLSFLDKTKIALKLAHAQTWEQLFSVEPLPPVNSPVNPLNLFEEGKDRIIIAGDSWAAFACGYHSMERMIEIVGESHLVNDWRCLTTAKLGMRAHSFLGSPEDSTLTEILKADQRVKYIYLSLGGNDLLDIWNKNMNNDQRRELVKRVYGLLQQVIHKYVELRPDIKVIVSGYDYPNFRKNHYIPLYKNIYNHMGQPSPAEINASLIRFSQYSAQMTDYKNIFYIHHLGLAHYYDGTPLSNMAPYITTPPEQISSFAHPESYGGDPNMANSDASMMMWAYLFHDAFHLNERNYLNVMIHTYNNVLVNIIGK